MFQEKEKFEIREVIEGSEPEEFWEVFPNGKTEYGNVAYLQEPETEEEMDENPHPARLFKCTEGTGKFMVINNLSFIEVFIMLMITLGGRDR